MKLKLSIAILFASEALVACGDKESTTEPTVSSNQPEVTAPVEGNSNIPQACIDYFDTVERFIAQYPDVGASYQAAIDQTKSQIESAADADKATFESTCQTALETFESQIANMPQ